MPGRDGDAEGKRQADQDVQIPVLERRAERGNALLDDEAIEIQPVGVIARRHDPAPPRIHQAEIARDIGGRHRRQRVAAAGGHAGGARQQRQQAQGAVERNLVAPEVEADAGKEAEHQKMRAKLDRHLVPAVDVVAQQRDLNGHQEHQ
ncbi:hypothetical protein chiPu_0028085, partial [Chiloscyllium punctatum]|nr:hypothetical protein [Chiloscyllium punctatum]